MAERDLWAMTHDARRRLVDDLRALPAEAWRRPTLCDAWEVEQVVAHLTAVAVTGRWAWLRSIALAGLRPAVHNDRRLREHLGPTPARTLDRFAAVAEATVAPTSDLAAYLGEVLVHGEDIRRPLGLAADDDVEALTAVAEFYAGRDFTVRSRTLTSGLSLRATDGPFVTGTGPEVAGPTRALVMAMAGRGAHLGLLDGPGTAEFAARVAAG